MEKWNEFCYTLSENISSNLSEDLFELKVIQALGVMGWKGFRGDLSVRSSFQVGASKRLIPDIVIKSGNKNLFVIEVKKPGIPLSTEFGSQLKSYMRQLKLDFGILIGQKIQIFYDGNLYGNSSFTLIDEIDFKRDSKKGLKFIELFSKENYSQQNLEQHAQIELLKLGEIKTIEKLKKELLSQNYITKVESYLKSELLNEHNESIVEKVFEKIDIKISDKYHSYSTQRKPINKNKQVNSITKHNQFSDKNKGAKIYNLTNPPSLAFTKIINGTIENESANNWQNLLRLMIKILLHKGIPIQEIKNKSSLNIKQGNINESGFHLITNTDYSLQNVDANIAGRVIAVLSKEFNIRVEVEFLWRDKPNAAFPNEYCKIIN